MTRNDDTGRAPEWLSLGKLQPHPDNPRIVLREPVIESIAADLRERGRFPVEHALLVRPLAKGDAGWQIIAGHHRVEAARRAKLAELPCWILPDCDDDEALRLLITTNNQGELDALEVGLHALRALPDDGGSESLRAYAQRIGRPVSRVAEYRQAARVVREVGCSNVGTLLGRGNHLVAIHKAAREHWEALVAWLLAEDPPSVRKLRAAVQRLEGLNGRDPVEWLDPDLVVGRVLVDEKFDACRVARLRDLADAIERELQGRKRDLVAFRSWLHQNREGDSWDVARLLDYRDRVRSSCTAPRVSEITCADCHDWLPTLPAQDLLLTDPPFADSVEDIDRFVAGWIPAAFEKLKPTGRAFIITGPGPSEQLAYLRELTRMKGWRVQQVIWHITDAMGPKSVGYKTGHRVIWYAAGPDAPGLEVDRVVERTTVWSFSLNGVARVRPRLHPWQTPDEVAERLARHGGFPGARAFDPFAGTGSLLIAAARLGCHARGCDESPEMVELAAQRGVARA